MGRWLLGEKAALAGTTHQVSGVGGVHTLRRPDLLPSSHRLVERGVVPAGKFTQSPRAERARGRDMAIARMRRKTA